MRVVVTGATGNVGTSVLTALADTPEVQEIVGVARRRPNASFAKTRFVSADVGRDDVRALFAGADVVVHLAWQLQPSHQPRALTRTNVEGSRRVFDAAVAARVPALVYASSVGAYAPAPKGELLDESWPATGIASSLYSRQKAEVERLLDGVARRHAAIRIVRFRPALIFKREAAAEIRSLFVGPLVPRVAFDRRLLRWVPAHPRLVFQCVHSLDVGRAFARAVVQPVEGPFNLAAHPPLDRDRLGAALGAKPVEVGRRSLRSMVEIAWRLRVLPMDAGWVDLAFDSPLMDTSRARSELGWRPEHSSIEALTELIDALRAGAGLDTPPLAPRYRAALRPWRHPTLRAGATP